MKRTVAQHIAQLAQFVREHPELSNAPINPDFDVEWDPERQAIVMSVVSETGTEGA